MVARGSWELMGNSFPSCPCVVLTHVARINCMLFIVQSSRLSSRIAPKGMVGITRHGRQDQRLRLGYSLWRTRRLARSPQGHTLSNSLHVSPTHAEVLGSARLGIKPLHAVPCLYSDEVTRFRAGHVPCWAL